MKASRLSLAITMLALCSFAFANDIKQCKKPVPPPPSPPPVTTTGNVNTNTNNLSSTSTASSNQTQGQQQGQTQTATGGNASASNGGQSNSQAVNQNQVRQAPAISGGLILPTANCLGSVTGGASAPVGGVMFGGSKVDKECRMQALANEFIGMGNYEAAAKVLCATKSAKEAKLTMDDCRLVAKPESTPAPVVESVPQVVVPSVTVPVTIVNPAPAPIKVIESPVVADEKKPIVKKRAARRLPPGCQNVTTVKCAIGKEK